MNFYVDSGGAILGVDPEKIYQGSANANTIRFVGAFASNVKVTVAFKLPTGVWTTPQLMTASTQLAGVVTSNGVQFNVWEYSIPALVTETFGTVNMQFYVYGDAGNGNGGLIATASSSFQVERGVPITLPDHTDDYETLLTQILSALSQIEGKLNFDDTPTIGSQNPVTSDGIAKALNTKASLQEDNTFEGYNTFQNEAYFDNAAYFDAGAFMYGMNYYLTDGPNRNDYYCYLTYNISKILIRFFMSDDQFDIEIPQKGGTIALLSDLTPIEEEVSKKYDKTGGTIDGNVTVTGDLTVQGTTITENAETLDVKANVITTNSEGVPLINLSGLGIRTDAANVYGIMYDPQSDSVKLGLGSLDEDNNFTFNQGEGLPIAVRDDSTAFTDKHVIVWDAAGDKFVDGGKDVSDLPTLAGNNDFTGENSFSDINFTGTLESKTDDHQFSVTYRENNGYMVLVKYGNQYATYTQGPGTIVNDNTNKTQVYYFYDHVRFNRNDQSSVYNFIFHGRTIENGIHNFYLPNKTGTYDLATTDDIPTDYATQTALANTQRQVDGLYTLLEQKNEIYVQTATDTYTTRETAGGENIADGVQTPVKKITGKTVKTTNLIPYPYAKGTDTLNGVTFTVNNDGTIIANGTATENAIFVFHNFDFSLSAGTYTISGLENGGADTYCLQISRDNYAESWNLYNGNIQIELKNTSSIILQYVVYKGTTVNNVVLKPMLNEGSTALPYMPYFSGLKNAFFKEIVSTGRNLFSAETAIPYNNCTYENGVVKQISADSADYYTWKIQFFKDSTFLTQSDVLFSQTGTIPALTIEKPSEANRLFLGLNGRERDTLMMIDVSNFPNGKYTATWNVLNITQGSVSWNNIMLNHGSSAFPYEPYTQSVLSLPEAVENGEWNTIDIENGKNILQGFTKTFDGTEDIQRTFKTYDYGGYPVLSMITNPYSYNDNATVNLITGIFNNVSAQSLITNKEEGICTYGEGEIRYFLFRINPIIYGCTMDSTDDELIAGFKAYLAAQHTAGNPLVVRYKTEEIQSETDISPSADSYIAWKNGSETIEQGDTDNSEYGAENTVEQDYYLLTAPQEVTKE